MSKVLLHYGPLELLKIEEKDPWYKIVWTYLKYLGFILGNFFLLAIPYLAIPLFFWIDVLS